MNTWGNRIKLSIFGESHGNAIGIVIDGLKAGFKIDFKEVDSEMKRRLPLSRNELDEYEILSGVYNGMTDGSPLAMMIKNTDCDHKAYPTNYIPRPSHADYSAYVKFGGYNDNRGGGHFSGRITAPLVFAGSIAKQILRPHGIKISSRIVSIGNADEESEFENELNKARANGDSVGGKLECCAVNIPVGLGEPFFGSVESMISSLAFSVPGVKAVEFGSGCDFASMYGSQANDEFIYDSGNVVTITNNSGGINGGLTNGMPIVFRVTFRPIPSIALKQKTVDLKNKKNTEIEIKGRHDVCILPRGAVVIESICALSLLELMGE